MTAAGLVAAVSVLGLLGLAGCDSHSKPTVPTEAPQSPDPAVSTSPTPSPLPATSSAPTVSQALPTTEITGLAALTSAYPSAAAAVPAATETVRNFVDALNHEIDTGDSTEVSKLFTPKCKTCMEDVQQIEALGATYTTRGGHLHLVSIDAAYPSYSEAVTVSATVVQDAADQLDAHGNVVHHFSASPSTRMVFNLQTDVTPPVIWQLNVHTE